LTKEEQCARFNAKLAKCTAEQRAIYDKLIAAEYEYLVTNGGRGGGRCFYIDSPGGYG
jgi:hypothetical protein